MPVSVDPARLSNLFRFGWALAEVQGRLAYGEREMGSPLRPEHALPLESERTWREQTIETRNILRSLADELQLDRSLDELSRQRESRTVKTAMARLLELEHGVSAGGDGLASVFEFFYAWDARIQDILAPQSYSESSAYQLGRGLAESYWALEPAPEGGDRFERGGYLFSEERIEALQRLLWVLAETFQPAPVDALSGSLEAWACLARDDDPVRRDALTYQALHSQIVTWHDVLLVGQPPRARVTSKDLLERARRMGPVLRAFIPEALLALLSLAAATAAAAFFAVGGVSSAVAPILAVLGGLGITGAGALASAKNEAHSLFTELQATMKADAAKQALTSAPADAYLGIPSSSTARLRARHRARKELAALRTRSQNS